MYIWGIFSLVEKGGKGDGSLFHFLMFLYKLLKEINNNSIIYNKCNFIERQKNTMKIYNKLVRDKIPEIINNDNEIAITRTLHDVEYLNELNKKLEEEVKEYLEADNIEELADIVEVIYGILNLKNVSIEEFEIIRKNKVEKRGAFNKKIFLEKVIEDEE